MPLPPTMTWRQRNYFHLNRNEFKQAIDDFINSLQEVEKQNHIESIIDSFKDLGLVLENKQWAFAAKLFNGAYALLQKGDPQSQAFVLSLMASVERRFLAR